MTARVRDLALRAAAALAARMPAEDARREGQILLGFVLGTSRAWLIAHDRDLVSDDVAGRLDVLLARRLQDEPVAYLVGRREFRGLDFRVTPAVLIPRPETEILVEAALLKMESLIHPRVLDLGTGSGCVAVSIAKARPDALVTAIDLSPAALEIAADNASELGAMVEFLRGCWYEPVAERRFDVIVANPPYIRNGDPHLSQAGLQREPQVALVGGADGLEAIRAIVSGAVEHLSCGGWLLLEHGYDQARDCKDLLHAAGFDDLLGAADLAGIERICGGRLLTEKTAHR